jgi:hypothetical protein
MYNVTLRRVRDFCCCGKPISTTYSNCVSVVLVIQHATYMRRIILSSVACPAVSNFPHHLINGTIFGKVIEHKMYVLFSLHLLSETFLIIRKIQRDIIIMYIGLHVKCAL